MNITITSRSGSGSAAGKIFATIFLSVFAIMGIAFTAFVGRAGFDTVRTYFWDKADCVIESSAASEKGGGFDFSVRYTYRFGGRTFTGTRFRMGMSPSMNGEDAQRAVQRYAAGVRTVCCVNGSNPAESALERGALWSLLFMIIPLVFVAIGVLGIFAVWRASPISAKPVSERHRAGGGKGGVIGLRVLALFFIGIGGGILYPMFIRPLVKEGAAAHWPQVPCEIISSHVQRHSGSKGGSTYSVEIRYRYVFGGHSYTGTRYNFDTGNSSSRGWRAEAVANFPPKLRTLCYVNPEDPIEAVLSVKPSPDRWFGLIPAVFLIIGLVIFFKAPAMTNRNISPTGLPRDALPRLPRDPATGEVELKGASSPMTGCIVMLVIALFWNGITWTILLNMPHGEWGGRIFLSIFALIGAALGVGVLYSFLAVFNPRPVLTASSDAVPLGGTLAVRWRFTGNVRRIVRLAITLDAREEATYRRGTTTTTDRNFFAVLPLLDTADRAQIAGGSAKVIIPRELIHTFTAPNNRIIWSLRVEGDIPRWPDVSAEFPITVLPREVATLFQEQNPTT